MPCIVLQESILDPLLLCCVNDMPISVKWNLLVYADDTVLVASTSLELYHVLFKDLGMGSEWLIWYQTRSLPRKDGSWCPFQSTLKFCSKIQGDSNRSCFRSELPRTDKILSRKRTLQTIIQKYTDKIEVFTDSDACLCNKKDPMLKPCVIWIMHYPDMLQWH